MIGLRTAKRLSFLFLVGTMVVAARTGVLADLEYGEGCVDGGQCFFGQFCWSENCYMVEDCGSVMDCGNFPINCEVWCANAGSVETLTDCDPDTCWAECDCVPIED